MKTHHRNLSLVGAGLLMTLLAAPARAETLTLTADADAHVDSRNTNTNFGSGHNMLVGARGGANYHRKIWMRFDLSTPARRPFTAATLTLTEGNSSSDNAQDIRFHGLLDGDAGEGWSESVITWNNAPGNNVAHSRDLNWDRVTPLLGTITPINVQGTVYEFSAQALLDFINADTDKRVTLILTSSVYNAFGDTVFYSKENTSGYDGPTLTLTPSPPPQTLIQLR